MQSQYVQSQQECQQLRNVIASHQKQQDETSSILGIASASIFLASTPSFTPSIPISNAAEYLKTFRQVSFSILFSQSSFF